MATKRIRIKIEGGDKYKVAAERYARGVRQGLRAGLFKEANGIITQAKQIVPVDEGILKNSGFAALPVERGNKVIVEMGFGGPAGGKPGQTNVKDVGYAVIVHEDLNAFHKVGTAKYLEMPIRQAEPGMGDRLAKDIRKAAGGAAGAGGKG